MEQHFLQLTRAYTSNELLRLVAIRDYINFWSSQRRVVLAFFVLIFYFFKWSICWLVTVRCFFMSVFMILFCIKSFVISEVLIKIWLSVTQSMSTMMLFIPLLARLLIMIIFTAIIPRSNILLIRKSHIESLHDALGRDPGRSRLPFLSFFLLLSPKLSSYGQIDLHMIGLTQVFLLVLMIIFALFFGDRLLQYALCHHIVLDYVEVLRLLNSWFRSIITGFIWFICLRPFFLLGKADLAFLLVVVIHDIHDSSCSLLVTIMSLFKGLLRWIAWVFGRFLIVRGCSWNFDFKSCFFHLVLRFLLLRLWSAQKVLRVKWWNCESNKLRFCLILSIFRFNLCLISLYLMIKVGLNIVFSISEGIISHQIIYVFIIKNLFFIFIWSRKVFSRIWIHIFLWRLGPWLILLFHRGLFRTRFNTRPFASVPIITSTTFLVFSFDSCFLDCFNYWSGLIICPFAVLS